MFLYLHFYALTAAFSQDRITEIRFIFPCQKTKTIRKNMKLWFQTLNNRQCRTVISEREETKKRNPMIAPPTYSWIEITDHIPGRENPGKGQWLCSVVGMSLGVQELYDGRREGQI